MLKRLTPEVIVGLVTAILGLAAAFGLPLTQDQTNAILAVTVLLAGIFIGNGAVTAIEGKRSASKVQLELVAKQRKK